MNHYCLLFVGLLLLAGAVVTAESIVINGSFEVGKVGDVPKGWSFANNKGCHSQIVLSDVEASEGKFSIAITNPDAKQPNVYGSLICGVKLEPGRKYQLSFDIKGHNANDICFIIGNRWKIGFRPGDKSRRLPEDWTHYSFEFTPLPEDVSASGNAMFRINTEDLCDSAWIDNVKIEPVPDPVVSTEMFQNSHVTVIPRISGDWKTWESVPAGFPVLAVPASEKFYTGNGMPRPETLSARISLGYDATGLLIWAEVCDDKVISGSGESLWGKDSVQLRISQGGSLLPGESDGDMEIGLSPAAENKVNSWSWQLGRPLDSDEAVLTSAIIPGGYRVAAHLNWSLLNKLNWSERGFFSFNLIVNDYDAVGSREVAFLDQGIHKFKSNQYNTLAILGTGIPHAVLVPGHSMDAKNFSGTVYLTGIAASPLTVSGQITDNAGKQINIKLVDIASVQANDVVILPVLIDLSLISDGAYQLNLLADTANCGTFKMVKADRKKQQLTDLDVMQKKFDDALRQLKERNIYGFEWTLQTAVIHRHLLLQRESITRGQPLDALNFYLGRAEVINAELDMAIDQLLEQISRHQKDPVYYQYVSSAISGYVNGLPVVKMRDKDNHITERPGVFCGYGHFDGAVNDLPELKNFASNIIQVEIGPSYVFPRPGPDNTFVADWSLWDRRVEAVLKAAWENDQKICLLLSPHYVPSWWMTAYPEARGSAKGFLNYDVNHVESRKMIAAYLEMIIPKLMHSPYRDALHSLCLSNEATYKIAKWERAETRALFLSWLKTKFQSIMEFNAIANTNFADFEALEVAGIENNAVRYAFFDFRRETFADWHKFMTDIVKSRWPEIKLSSKIMMAGVISPAGLEDSIDPELYAQFSDYNGNDNYMNYGSGRWASDWFKTSFGHDLQFSMQPKWILNSENHIIKDAESGFIPPDHIYTANFEQFLQGVGGLITWVWQPNTFELFQKNYDIRGNIYHRPAAIIAQGRAALDGNRLVNEIAKFVQGMPRVALLYSPSSHIQNAERYCGSLEAVYTALVFSGHKVGFISEKQLERHEFRELKMIVATDVSHISEAAAAGLAAFTADDGQVISAGDSFQYNSYGKKLDRVIAARQISGSMTLGDSVKFWDRELAVIEPLPVKLEVLNARDNVGIFFRIVNTDQGWLVNIVNYNNELRRIRLTGDGTFYDLLADRELQPELDLDPLKPLFLRFTVK